jgi:hypothetical protein
MPDLVALAKGALDIANGLNNADLIRIIVELKNEAADLLIENLELKERIKALEDGKENPLVYNDKDGLYYSTGDTDSQHPFCPACYDTDKKRIHLLPSLKCPGCKAGYYQFKPSDIQTRRTHTAGNVLKGY